MQSVISRSGRWKSGPVTAGGCAWGRGPQALKNICRQELTVLTSARPQVPSTPGTGLRLACRLASYPSLKLSWCTQAKGGIYKSDAAPEKC